MNRSAPLEPRTLASALVLTGVLALAGAAPAVTISDGTFANGDWTATVLAQTGGASQTVIGQVGAGGSPGAYRRMAHGFAGAGLVRVYHEYQSASFDPSTLGPDEMLWLEYSEDRIQFLPPFAGAQIGAAAALRQDGVVYVTSDINFGSTSWTTRTLTGLGATSFTEIGGSAHPDFSASGSPITFGYFRANSNTGGSSFTTTHGIDDWTYTTHTAALGTIVTETKISDTAGGFLGTLANSDDFGECVAYLGDVDGDGIGDLATSTRDDASAPDAGAVWILFMNADDTVKGFEKIGYDGVGGFVGVTGAAASAATSHRFGVCGAGIGDVNYDGVPDLAVGVANVNDGAVWVLLLNADGSVRSERRIAEGAGGFPSDALTATAGFGRDVARLGDVDGDGVVDLVVGAPGQDDGGADLGAVFVLFLEPDGHVKSHTKISEATTPALGLVDGDGFGFAATGLGDVDGDGIPDLAVGAWRDDEVGSDSGAAYVLLLNADGTVKAHQKHGAAAVGGGIDAADRFGIGIGGPGDVDGDGIPDLAVGATRDDDGGTDRGATWLLFLNADGSAKGFQKISALEGNFTGPLAIGDEFGIGIEGYTGADGAQRLVIGAMQDDDGGSNRGALYVLRLAALPQPLECGDFLRAGPEECDDGNTASGDTCSSSCEIEEVAFLRGTASGGSVSVTVSGQLLNVPTAGGESAEQVLVALASAIQANPTLQGLGVVAATSGQVLYTTGSLTASASSDAGLVFGERDDLRLEGSRLEISFMSLEVGQGTPSLTMTASASGEFVVPAGIFATPYGNVDHAAIDCAMGAGTPLTTQIAPGFPFTVQQAYIGGTAGLRCFGALDGTWLTVRSLYSGPVTVPYALDPIGVGGTSVLSATAVRVAAAGLPWTEGPAAAEDLIITGTLMAPVHLPGSTVVSLTFHVGIRDLVHERGVEARRADGIGVFNPVAPAAFNVAGLTSSDTWAYQTDEVGFARLRLRFVSEPSRIVGLAAGVTLAAWLALRKRRR